MVASLVGAGLLLIIISIGRIKTIIHLILSSSKLVLLGRSPHRKGMGLLHMGRTVSLCQTRGAPREVTRGYHQLTSRLSRGIIRFRPRLFVQEFGMVCFGGHAIYAERTLRKWQRGEHWKSMGAEMEHMQSSGELVFNFFLFFWRFVRHLK